MKGVCGVLGGGGGGIWGCEGTAAGQTQQLHSL